MTAYKWCMKISVVLNPFTLNKQSLDRQRMLGHKREDHMTNIRKIPNGCGEWGKMRAHKLKEDGGIGQSKPGGMKMMDRWMEVGSKLAIGVK